MQVKLHLVKGNPQGKQVEVPLGTLTVGRAEDSDLIIASTRVSRHHCEFLNEANRVVVRDKGSGNGTLVNGVKAPEHILAPGDEVQIGPLTFAVEIDGKRQKAASPVARPAAQAKAAPKPAARGAVPPKAPVAKPVSGGKPGGPAIPARRTASDDILASLERLAAGKKPAGKPAPGQKSPPPPQKKGGEVLEISDEDLLDTDK
jgi:predicted component of type VI protein secretion system